MARKSDQTPAVSVRYWFFAQLLIAIPLVNVIAVPVLAFVGRDQTKKNFYRALILWVILLVGIQIVAILIVGGPKLIAVLQDIASGGVDAFLQQQHKPEVQ